MVLITCTEADWMSRNLTQATGKSIAMSSNDSHSLQVDDWVYRDEGHANIVIASRLVGLLFLSTISCIFVQY